MHSWPQHVPDLEPGINLLWAPPRSRALHQVALSALHDATGTARWIDARDAASTTVLHELATPRTLHRLNVARSWTAYQHHELIRQLPGAVDAKTDLIIVPSVASLYADDDAPSPEDRQYLTSTLVILAELSRVLGLSVFVSCRVGGAFSELIRACESIVSPLGWDRQRIKRYLQETRDVSLSAFERIRVLGQSGVGERTSEPC